MAFALIGIAVLLFVAIFACEHTVQRRRIAERRNLSHEMLLPRHYKSFTEVESRLWNATRSIEEEPFWHIAAPIRLRPEQFQLVRNYIGGLREDFVAGDRIFGAVIAHSPVIRLLAQLEWERLKIELAFYAWYLVIWFRLKTGRVSPTQLRHLTQTVSALARQVRVVLIGFERAGHSDFVDFIIRKL